jgi:TonB-linked SusC/RagA family outer membrane protein
MQTDGLQTFPTTDKDPGRQVASGQSFFQTANAHSWIIEPQVNYNLQLGKSTFSALVGGTFQQNNTNSVNIYANGFPSDALLQDIQAASSATVQNNSAEYRYEALYGRLGYDWMGKYVLNLTARRDGTTRFGPGKQFGNFGAVGAGWIFTKESFIPKNDFLTFGKLRGSYGLTGSDQVPDYQFIDTYSPVYYPYQGSTGLYPNNLFNPDLAWETTKKLEVGIELGFFNGRINILASFYRNRSGNELVQTPVSEVTGFATIASNLPALVQNTGQEFELNTVNVKAKDFTWSSSFNITDAKNKLLAYPNLASSPYANSFVIGQPINVIKLYQYAGVNPTTGIYQFVSSNGSLTSSPNSLTDRTKLMDLTPKFYGGLQNSFSYKGFSLDIFFQFVNQRGPKLWRAFNGLFPGTMFNEPLEVLNRWQKPGDVAEFEQFTQNNGSAAGRAFNYASQSTFAYGDASYIRMKNAALSWKMPQVWAKKTGASNLRIYIQAENLLTITKYDGMDPESQSAATGPRRAYVAGLQAGF